MPLVGGQESQLGDLDELFHFQPLFGRMCPAPVTSALKSHKVEAARLGGLVPCTDPSPRDTKCAADP